MPGIKLAKFSLAGTKLKLLCLTLLTVCFSYPALAAELRPSIQILEWSGDTSGGTAASEVTAEASQYDVWQRIRTGFKIDDAAEQNPLIAAHESWYASRPESVQRMVERSRRYLFHIVQEVDRRAMPMEIALLPMIESAFNPTALSPSAASGIWQFIPSTGRQYGLRQDTWYDGRRDFTASTNAALDYLSKLYLDFGDWQLALAAYNCGEGCVARAIQKNVRQGLPTDYASLPLPSETRHYVPKLLAIRNLIRNPEQYGIAINMLPNQPYFDQVTVHASMDVHSAARLADMSSDEFLALNAAFPRKLIRSDTPVNLLLPVNKADTFQRNLQSGNWDSWQPYSASKGERPEAIAKRFGISEARLKEHNQLQLKRGKLVRAQTILVPVKGRAPLAAKTPSSLMSVSMAAKAPSSPVSAILTAQVQSSSTNVTAAAKTPSSPTNPSTVAQEPSPAASSDASDANLHNVQRGETLYGVARRYGLTYTQLIEANPGLDDEIKPGQTLRLPLDKLGNQSALAIQPVASTSDIPKPAQPGRYTVERGDTLHAIARRFNVSLSDIRNWNPDFSDSSAIQAGQTIVVKVN